MPTRLRLELQGDAQQKHGYYLASLLQGVLMEKMDRPYAAHLHESGLHPYSQYISFEDGRMFWNIQTLTEEAQKHILPYWREEQTKEIYLEHRKETLLISGKKEEQISEKELIESYYFGSCDPILRLHFLTPTSFKQDGHYCIFPDIRLIFQSLMMRYDANSEKNRVFSENLLNDYEKHVHVTGYRLKSTIYDTNHVRIPSFIGSLTLKINGPQPMINLAWMLAVYGTWSGVGIKTGLGMGALGVSGRESRNGK